MNKITPLKNRKIFVSIGIIILLTLLDLYSKYFIFAILEDKKTSIYEITSFFNLVTVINKGVSFGMFNELTNAKIIFVILQFLLGFLIFIWMLVTKQIHLKYILPLIIAGAFGNAIDRAINGGVADFLDFHIGAYHWPAFNLADCFVCIGVFLLIFENFFFKKYIPSDEN